MSATAAAAPLQTERLVLEPLTAAHAPALFPGLRDPKLYEHVPQDPPPSVAALARRFEELGRGRSWDESEEWLNWALRLKQGGEYAGRVEATVRRDGSASIAYFVFGPFQRRGLAREACSAMIARLRERGARTITANADERNAASLALLDSLGFRRTARLRNAAFFKGRSSHEIRFELSS